MQNSIFQLANVSRPVVSFKHFYRWRRKFKRRRFLEAGLEKSAALEFSAPAVEMLERYDWPGNVRELENAVLHAVSLSDNLICPEHLPVRIRQFQPVRNGRSEVTDISTIGDQQWMTLAEMEADYVVRVLESTGNNKQAASRILNIDRKTLSRIATRARSDN